MTVGESVGLPNRTAEGKGRNQEGTEPPRERGSPEGTGGEVYRKGDAFEAFRDGPDEP